MRNTNSFFSILLLVLLTVSCSKKDTNTTPPVTPGPNPTQQLTVSISKNQITADGFEETTISVKDQSNTDVTASSTIYINNAVFNGTTFFTNTTGSYQVKAIKGTLESAAVTLTAIAPGPSPFTQKVLIEDFTGTWCGICPGVIIPLDEYTNTKPNLISIGVHGPAGSNDPFKYVFDPQLRSTYSISGVPTVLLNRDGKWNQATTSLDQLAEKRALLGLALETSVSGSVITVKAKVKFDITTSLPLKIVVVLVENGLLYNQANYGHFGLPNPIPNFPHKNVLRTAATDIFGDVIPAAQLVKGNTWEKTYSFNASAYNISNCRIIGFVLYDTNTQGKKGVLNAQIASAGQTQNFD